MNLVYRGSKFQRSAPLVLAVVTLCVAAGYPSTIVAPGPLAFLALSAAVVWISWQTTWVSISPKGAHRPGSRPLPWSDLSGVEADGAVVVLHFGKRRVVVIAQVIPHRHVYEALARWAPNFVQPEAK